MNNSSETKLKMILLLIGLSAIVATYFGYTAREGAHPPLRTTYIEIASCVISDKSISVILGDNLIVKNIDTQPHTVSVFQENLYLEPGEKGVLQLKHEGPIYGKLACDREEIMNLYLMSKEVVGSL